MKTITKIIACVASLGALAGAASGAEKPRDTYSLLIITEDGSVHVEPGLPSLGLCRDAESLIKFGRTVAEQEALNKIRDAENRKAAAEFRAAHPCHKPETDWERSAVQSGHGSYASSNGTGAQIENGQVCPTTGAGWQMTTYGFEARPKDVKYARCLLDEREDKPRRAQ